jgi:cell wall assembly regulator SMI1
MADITWKYVKKLQNEAAVEVFEKANNVRFPQDLKECIKENNGGRPDKKLFDTDKAKERVFKTLFSFNESDVENMYKFFPIPRKDVPDLLPFASDPGGNFLCVSAKENKIVLYLHETGTLESVADSFSDFLSKLYSN